MAVATPVLEREITTEKTIDMNQARVMTIEEINAARIKANFANIMNPDFSTKDAVSNMISQNNLASEPCLVESARTNADLFRADSVINRAQAVPVVAESDDEENEDLRPTQTTIQYKTIAKQKEQEEELRSVSLSKKEKILIATFVGIVIALFAVIIINSAILSSMTANMNGMQANLLNVQQTYEALQTRVENAMTYENIHDFAQNLGMIR